MSRYWCDATRPCPLLPSPKSHSYFVSTWSSCGSDASNVTVSSCLGASGANVKSGTLVSPPTTPVGTSRISAKRAKVPL